ncbi:hypothetical protein J6590_035406 [Homalodisca vitripennis]|nr:hypothetical protein J6590_035406 [Homalodisca vitripennis]
MGKRHIYIGDYRVNNFKTGNKRFPAKSVFTDSRYDISSMTQQVRRVDSMNYQSRRINRTETRNLKCGTEAGDSEN